MDQVVTFDFELRELELEDDGPHYCESIYHQEIGLGLHVAQWQTFDPCGDIHYMCERRRLELNEMGYWMCCGRGCGKKHYVWEILWEPLKGGGK